MMYVFQFQDGTWRIALETNSHLRPGGMRFGAILANAEADRLYQGVYRCEADARTAERRIRELVQ